MSGDKNKVSRLVVIAASLSAGFFFLAYFAVSFSTYLASQSASSVEEFHYFELRNGIVFSALCSLGLFAVIYFTLCQMDRKEQEAAELDKRIQGAERRLAATMVVHTVIHDTNNLLGVIRSGLSMLRDPNVAIDPASLCDRMGTAIDRVEDMHRQWMRREREMHAREATLDVFSIEGALKELRSYARLHPRLKDCRLYFSGGENLKIKANRTEFAQAVLNLMLNAADATGNVGRIRVEGKIFHGQIRLQIEDNGPGIPEEDREKIFSAFVSGKAYGMGLGLMSVKGFCDRCGGSIEVGISRWQGALFTIDLPMASQEVDAVVKSEELAALGAR